MNRPIFILGCHKSGTSLLRNLLDGTPGLFVIPIETHFLEITGFQIFYALRKQNFEKVGFENMLMQVRNMLEKSNEKSIAATQYGGDSLGSGKWDINLLVNYLERHGKNAFEQKDYRTFFQTYFEAIQLSLLGKLPVSEVRYVEKSVENAEYAGWLKKLYPDAVFIHIVRNPYAVLVSIRKFRMLHGHYPYLGNTLDAMEFSYYNALTNPLSVEDYKIVRYEDLVSKADETMQSVAALLNVPYTENMTTPTAMGETWQGNSMTGEKFSGVSSQPLSRWESAIHPLEIHLVNKYLSPYLTAFDYQPIHSGESPLRPAKGETLRTYAANRFLVFSKK